MYYSLSCFVPPCSWINDPGQNTRDRLYTCIYCISLLVNRLTVSSASMNSLFSNRSYVSDLWPLVFVKYILGRSKEKYGNWNQILHPHQTYVSQCLYWSWTLWKKEIKTGLKFTYYFFVIFREYYWPISRYTWFFCERVFDPIITQGQLSWGEIKEHCKIITWSYSRGVCLNAIVFSVGVPTVRILWANLLQILDIGSKTLSTFIWNCQIVFVSMLIVFMTEEIPFLLMCEQYFPLSINISVW